MVILLLRSWDVSCCWTRDTRGGHNFNPKKPICKGYLPPFSECSFQCEGTWKLGIHRVGPEFASWPSSLTENP
jgi:hypothetical protein